MSDSPGRSGPHRNPKLSDADLRRIEMWAAGYRCLMRGGNISNVVHGACTTESEIGDGVFADLRIEDVERMLVQVRKLK